MASSIMETAAVRPHQLERPVDCLRTASTSSSKVDMVSKGATSEPHESRLPTLPLQSLGSKPSNSKLSALSAAAALLKDKTHHVAQQQKRALSAFQQKGGLVGWLHGEFDGSDQEYAHSTPVTPNASDSPSCRESTLHDNLWSSWVLQTATTEQVAVEKLVGRRHSVPLDIPLDKAYGDTIEQSSSSTVVIIKSLPSSISDVDTRSTSPKAQPPAPPNTPRSLPNTRVSLDDILSDEWNCMVLWAYLYSSGRDHYHHHQRLSFLIETTFRITPLYRHLAGGGDNTLLHADQKLLTLVVRLYRRFLVQHGASPHATGGVPVASPAASHAKNELSTAIHSIVNLKISGTESTIDAQVEKVVSLLLQLAREVERELRMLGTTHSSSNFADSTLYRDFIARQGGPKNLVALLRAARIPFYQQPNVVASSVCLDSLALEQNEGTASVFSRAKCQVFAIAVQSDGSLKFTDMTRDTSSTKPIAGQALLLHTIEPFLNPSASLHSAASKPFAFNFTAGSGDNMLYGAAMWLPAGQCLLQQEDIPHGVCIVSQFPFVNSLRHFLSSMWKSISSNCSEAKSLYVARASLAMESHFLACQRKTLHEEDQDRLPMIDFRLDDLFDSLSLTHILRLFAFVLLEKKIVLVASSYTVLFSVSETLKGLLYPLVWSHVYVPVLPLALKDCLQCPTPFIFGLHESYVRRSELPRPSNDFVVVNLDRDSLTGGGDIFLPPLRHSMLREELVRLCKPHSSHRDSIDTFDGSNCSLGEFPTLAIRRVFYQHLCKILTSLESCVHRFDFRDQFVSVIDNFNSSQWSADAARFYAAMLHTQAVSTFLTSPDPMSTA